jgi:hypothetical protein
MGDKSPKNQIKIGNITVKLNPNNQQKTNRDSNYEKNYHKGNDRNSGSNDRYKERSNERERNRYQNDNNRYTNKKNEYDNKRDKYNKKYKNSSHSPSKHRHSHHHSRSRSRSRDRDHSHHNNQNKYYNTNEQGNNNNNQNSNNLNNNNSQNNNNAPNVNMTNPIPNKNFQNNINNNMAFMNPMNQNYLNNYNEFIKQFYQMNGLKNNNVNNIIVPIGIPVNYFYNSNFNNMNQMNKNNNMNNQNKNNNQTNNQNNQNQKEEPSNTILITDLDTNITKETLEDIFRDKCLKLQISMPIDIRLVEALNIAYVIFPSITSCVIVYNSLLNQKILINGKYFPVQFSPNLTQKYSNNRDTLTYVTQISSNTSLTTSMETTVHEDWYCVYCDSKNFSRRTICFKCQKPKSINCRVVPVIKQKKIILGANGEILPNNSIIIQGKQIQYSNEGEVFIFF